MEKNNLEPQIGDRVRATMNNTDWYEGEYTETSDVFAQYGVLRDDINQVRFFITAEKI